MLRSLELLVKVCCTSKDTNYTQWYFSMKLVKNFFGFFLSCGNLLSVILYQNALKSSLLVYKWCKNHIVCPSKWVYVSI